MKIPYQHLISLCFKLFDVFVACFFSDYNFSHRIDHFSFGTPVSGAVYPLDSEEHVTNESKTQSIVKKQYQDVSGRAFIGLHLDCKQAKLNTYKNT